MTILRVNALFDTALAVLLSAGSWDALYDALDLPVPKPALYAQLAGVLLLGWAWLLWTRPLGRVVAAVNALAAALIVVWLAAGKVTSDALGITLFALVAAALVAFAVAEARG